MRALLARRDSNRPSSSTAASTKRRDLHRHSEDDDSTQDESETESQTSEAEEDDLYDDEIVVRKDWEPSLRHARASSTSRATGHRKEGLTVTKLGTLASRLGSRTRPHTESPLTSMEDISEASSSNSRTTHRRRDRDDESSAAGSRRGASTTRAAPSYGSSTSRGHHLFSTPRPRHRRRDDDEEDENRRRRRDTDTDDESSAAPSRRRSTPTRAARPLPASTSAATGFRGDLAALTSAGTTAEAIVGGPRTIEDVWDDINRGIGAPNAHYTNGIIGAAPPDDMPETRIVRLASVNPAEPTSPSGKLLDAGLEKVTVYRRFTESSLSDTDKARVILSAMGIPPDKSKGFELPSQLVINGATDPNDPIFTDTRRNRKSVAVIKEMFRLYEVEKQRELDLDAASRPSTPGSVV